jgi:glycosyltransferase involved in cell wall biosynthesis
VVMASTVDYREDHETAVPTHSPILSIIMPVYNGSKKIESTLEQVQSRIEKLHSIVAKLDAQPDEGKGLVINTGRNVLENAGAAMLLDEYLSKNPEAVATVIKQSHAASKISEGWYEIIVVNDGSKDDTRNVVQRIVTENKSIRLISYSTNMGKGYAIRQGVLHSSGKFVMFLDGDGEISAEVLSKYLAEMSNADIVIGSKYHPQSVISVPFSRKFFSKCFHLFVKVALGIKVSDTQVGLKVGKGDAFRKIFQRVTVKRYAFDAEMIAIADILGLKIVELPVKIDLDKSFKKKDIIKMAIDVLGVAFRLHVIKWYQKNMEQKRPTFRPLVFA